MTSITKKDRRHATYSRGTTNTVKGRSGRLQISPLRKAVSWMKVRLLYSEDCPSHDEALQRLQDALSQEGIQADVEVVRVDTFEEAEKEHFPGSPTITIDGNDICPIETPQYAPACRAYVLEDGRISPLPSVAMMRKAIRSAKENLKSG
jgi:hypothetical protein